MHMAFSNVDVLEAPCWRNLYSVLKFGICRRERSTVWGILYYVVFGHKFLKKMYCEESKNSQKAFIFLVPPPRLLQERATPTSASRGGGP